MARANEKSAFTSGQGMLVVIDPAVEDYDFLKTGVRPGAQVIVLNKEQEAIAQITAQLKETPHPRQTCPFNSVHLVAPSSPGILHFSSGDFSLQTLDPYVEQLQTWFTGDGSAASPAAVEPQLLLYGRRVGAGQSGTEFMDTLSWLTGAKVIAAKNGDRWPKLEGEQGEQIALAFPSSIRQSYQGTFSV
ncbi:MAG: DUF4347 domain-containing protein [Phormidesmis sp.]